jgi:hypothetical protein
MFCTAILSLEEQCYRYILLIAATRRAGEFQSLVLQFDIQGWRSVCRTLLPASCIAIFSLGEKSED